jgi:DNA-binding CsgD family transcriptional regulator/PAS domain-containing protein
MSIDDTKLNDLILRIYDAVQDDTLWPSIIHELARLVEAEDSLLFSSQLVENNPLSLLSMLSPYAHADSNSWEAYASYFWQCNVWEQGYTKLGMQKTGCIIQGDQIIERAAFLKTEMFCDFLKPMHSGMGVNLVAVLFDRSAPDQSPQMMLSLCKPSFAEAFTQEDERLLRHLLPHMQRALSLRWKMAGDRQNQGLKEQALDHISAAVILTDATGRIVFANRKAELILRCGGNPTVLNGHLGGVDAYENNAVKLALRQAQAGIGSTLRLGNAAPIGTRVATFSPISATNCEHLSTPAHVMVMIAEPNQHASGDFGAFAKLYKLTTAETRVLKHLLQQQSTQEMAETLQISMNTLRTQLKSLFAKTHTKNQRELIQFCLSHLMIL